MSVAPYITRPYGGSSDLAAMTEVINARMDSEGGKDHTTVGAMAQQYEHLKNCDPVADILIAERNGFVVGYARTMWEDTVEGYREYWIVVEAHPDHSDILDDLYDWVEARARDVASRHPAGDKYLVMWTDEAMSRAALLRRRGYLPHRYGAEMVRSHLDDIPDRSLPPGVEVRPVHDSHLRAIWEADCRAFRDARDYSERTEADFESWRADPNWDPALWQVAWAGNGVVGQVRSYIDAGQNERFGRRRGWTENISTEREWRRHGIASALICSSLRILKEVGMTEAALGVDIDSPTGAHHLYVSLGYVRTRLECFYRRPLESS